jgi:hypothetical protein
MPIITSSYQPPHIFKNGHLSTIYAGVFRKVAGVVQQRERIILEDTDFLDLDWSHAPKESAKLIILLHGLEGNAQRPYMLGAAKLFNQNGFDVLSVNHRSCSGQPNRLYRSYHSGAVEDLDAVITHVLENKNYSDIYLKGFSLGGNLALKYLGTKASVPKEIKGAVAVSVPCFLYGSMLEIYKTKNFLYANKFKTSLKEKLRQKQKQFPEKLKELDLKNIKTLKDFDDVYTSQAHGYKNALDYYEKASSLQELPNIKLPTLILNAKNDSFLSAECFPIIDCQKNKALYLEIPNFGGHVGFYDKNNVYYNEKRALQFIESI